MSLLRTFSTLSSLYLITIWSHHADIDITWPISFSIIDNSHRSRMEHGTLIRISDIWYTLQFRFVWCHDLTCLPLLSISLFIPPIKRSKLHYLALVTQWNSSSSLLIIEVKIRGNYCEQRQDKQWSRDFPWGEQTLPRPRLTDCPVSYYDPPPSQNGKNNIIISSHRTHSQSQATANTENNIKQTNDKVDVVGR